MAATDGDAGKAGVAGEKPVAEVAGCFGIFERSAAKAPCPRMASRVKPPPTVGGGAAPIVDTDGGGRARDTGTTGVGCCPSATGGVDVLV